MRPVIRGRRCRPHRTDDLDRLRELRYANASARVVVAVGAILLLEPARAETEDVTTSRELLECVRHARDQRRVAVALTQDEMAEAKAWEGSGEVCEQRPPLGDRLPVGLEMVGDPDGREGVWQRVDDCLEVCQAVDAFRPCRKTR